MTRDQQTDEERRGRAPLLNPTDTVIAVLLLAGCAFLYWETTRFDEVPSFLGQNVLPEHFPRLILYLIGILALIIPFEHRLWPERWRKIRDDRSEPIPKITLATMGLLILIVFVEPYIGTTLSIATVSLAMPLLWGERRWHLLIPFVVLFTLTVTFVFSEILRVYFEPGIFGISF